MKVMTNLLLRILQMNTTSQHRYISKFTVLSNLRDSLGTLIDLKLLLLTIKET